MRTEQPSHPEGAAACRVCSGEVQTFLDLGRQPLSDAFPRPGDYADEFHFDLEVGRCARCSMTQLLHVVPRDRMFHADYPYRSSGSVGMARHFEAIAHRFRDRELSGPDPFIVEIGSNDGVMLRTVAQAGIRHLGVDPSSGVGDSAREQGVRVLTDFFEEETAAKILATEGEADVIYAANTLCHIPTLDSVRGTAARGRCLRLRGPLHR